MRDKVRDYAQVLPTIIIEISELNHLSPDSSVREVISELKKLLNKPPITLKDNTAQSELVKMKETITKLEKKLKEKGNQKTIPNSDIPFSEDLKKTTPNSETPFGEDLEVIKQLELTSLTELFGVAVDLSIRKQIEDAINYSQVVQARQTFLAKHLTPQSTTTITSPSPTTADNF